METKKVFNRKILLLQRAWQISAALRAAHCGRPGADHAAGGARGLAADRRHHQEHAARSHPPLSNRL